MLLLLAVVGGAMVIGGCNSNKPKPKSEPKQVVINEDKAVASIVKSFGNKLQTVSLLAPKDIVAKNMQESYGNLVSQALIQKWSLDPLKAPGRLTSSPWPDRINILGIVKSSNDIYEVKGEIIEITNVEKASVGVAAKRPITLVLKKIDNHWLIDNVTIGTYEEADSSVYKNTQYGFNFHLPKNWNNYTTITDKWDGLSLSDLQNGKIVENGPIIYIRHPQWTFQNKRQDIPIMIFTIKQWDSLQKEEFHIGAAPIGPGELGRNSKYVFALPARYNFAFPTGYEEVENILKSKPLYPTENYNQKNK